MAWLALEKHAPPARVSLRRNPNVAKARTCDTLVLWAWRRSAITTSLYWLAAAHSSPTFGLLIDFFYGSGRGSTLVLHWCQ
ncbi:hypothetical protein SKAU_G00033250 [Synaphobranchus kaupii]|uniref:Uncharacterized protein n=1 Tax=Synaphobranchus kaupii TaxID=118154 RepID=A0A9Q1GG89_SYNKA|nr:hypothetical protein SKAU_G00033250 [Synaphobranchus kaupii]